MVQLQTGLEPGHDNAASLHVARDLAVRHHASVVGIAVSQPAQLAYANNYVYPNLIEEDRIRLDTDLAAAETEFHAAFAGFEATEWRSFVIYTGLADKVAAEARCADLVVTGAGPPTRFMGQQRMLPGDLVMQAARPVLVVPDNIAAPGQQRILVAWTDTREARRAIHDALPLLRMASSVALLEIAEPDNLVDARIRLDDVATWLNGYGIHATRLPTLSTGDVIVQLNEIADAEQADLVVAGAYGHSRISEWALGGMTRSLLHHGSRCCLLSH